MKKKVDLEGTIYGTDEFEVRIGKTQTIIPVQERLCPSGFVFKLLNGELIVGGEMSGLDYPVDKHSMPLPPGQTSHKLSWRRSKDGGQTWHETPPWLSYGTHQFSDGEIMQISGRWWQREKRWDKTYTVALFRSTDNGYTFKEERIPLLGIPRLAKVKCQYSEKERYANVNHRIIEAHDGNLLASVQGRFEDDIKERTFIIRSTNRGKLWNYLSTVAFDLTKRNGIRPLGFDEPNLLVLPSGEILCFMRSGSKRGNPLYMSRSKDNGRTWNHADSITDRGVYPTACLMKSGIIAVVYGRPGDWLIFSLDQGKTWVSHFCFNQSPKPYDCGNYDWIEEIVPDTLLAVYSRTDPNDNMKSAIMGTYITVKQK